MKYETRDPAFNYPLVTQSNSLASEEYGENLLILKINDQIKELQTIIRDK